MAPRRAAAPQRTAAPRSREPRYNVGMESRVAVYLEMGSKRTFAGAIDWPGWCRSGRGEPEALEALLAFGPRYAAALGRTAPTFATPVGTQMLEVVERLKGNAGTDFGAPMIPPSDDVRPITGPDIERLQAILEACWAAFDEAAAAAAHVELRKGPRGGGRNIEQILAHVVEAEKAYLAKLGARLPRAAAGPGDQGGEMARLRWAIRDALSVPWNGRLADQPGPDRTKWSPRYFVRRVAWHALDHAWEIEDRASATDGTG